MKLFLHMARSMSQGLRLAGLGLAVFVVAAPVATNPTVPREELTSRLVPVTGEPQRSVDLTVPFARNSARLTATAREQLDELGAALAGETLKALQVGVHGHTDASGPAAYNQTLSEKRATAVVKYLVERFSLDRERLSHAGYGEERLLPDIKANSPRHRRVEVVVFAPVTRAAPETPTTSEPESTAETSEIPRIPSTGSGEDNPEPRQEDGGSAVQVVQ